MIINQGNLRSLGVAFSAAYQRGLSAAIAASVADRIATEISSSTSENEYGWLGDLPGLREWIGDRVVNGLLTHGYSVKNKTFELTIGVDRDKIEDDQVGIYSPRFEMMGNRVQVHKDQLVFGLLKSGSSTLCYDGQNYFDTDHPALDENGNPVTQSNWDDNSGSGTPWYLLDTSMPIKPIIFQNRKAPQFTAMDAPTDENVFNKKEFRYGVDCRRNVGFGFWQMAYGSRKALDEANLVAAYTAFTERKGDYGIPLGLKPNLLVVPPGLKFAASKLVNATTLANGADNVMKGLVEVVDTAWLL